MLTKHPHSMPGDETSLVNCLYCEAEMFGHPYNTREEADASAIKAWNRRAPPQAQQEGEV